MITLNNISKSYGDNNIFKNFNMSIEEKSITCILGHSGVGKTTLLNLICGLVKPDSGSISIPKDCKFSYVFQEPRLLDWCTVYQNIDVVLKKVYNSADRKNIVMKYINFVDLNDCANQPVNELSGGMAQRVSIARAFAYPSNILILDEPFKGLDLKLEEDLIGRFMSLWEQDKRTVIFITHNIEQAVKISKAIYVLNKKPVEIVKQISLNELNSNTKEIIRQYI